MIDFKELATALRPATAPIYKIPAKLLSKGNTNAKTAKNNLDTFILYLAPATQNSKGAELCPHRTAGCTAACLFTAGRGKFGSVKNARVNKTEYFLSDPKTFLAQLALELIAINKRYKKQNKKAAIRLNGTTDRDFLYLLGKKSGLNWEELTSLVFYDYTKTLKKAQRYSRTNYIHAFSRSEDNEAQAIQYLQEGGIVAAVFADTLPDNWKGFVVWDGDKSDDLMLDAAKETSKGNGIVLGLKAKGDARKDNSGFVIDTLINN